MSITDTTVKEHPRVCGENVDIGLGNFCDIGTSPRMRGKPVVVGILRIRNRNIPAYAGKTIMVSLICSVVREHPRVCGENHGKNNKTSFTVGTSPRMRGKLRCRVSRLLARGNIPAYAGKTFHYRVIPAENQEHPRVCGENKYVADNVVMPVGTSPRMRGKPSLITVLPAVLSEHPRVCGENAGDEIYGTLSDGTSPRMRGKRSA